MDVEYSTLPQPRNDKAAEESAGPEDEQKETTMPEDHQPAQAGPNRHQPASKPFIWPACAHSFMTRIYQSVYVAFDDVGEYFSENMSLGKFGPDARSQPYSLLHELTPAQVASYTGPQLAYRLAERDHVHTTIAHERTLTNHHISHYAKPKYPYNDIPWMPSIRHECQFKACARCYFLGRDKSFVHLDSVLNGDIPPTLATGFSFSFNRTRPVADAKIVQNLGCRPIALPRGHPGLRRPIPGIKHRIRSPHPTPLSPQTARATTPPNPADPTHPTPQTPPHRERPCIVNGSRGSPTAARRMLPSLTGAGNNARRVVGSYVNHREVAYALACVTPLPKADYVEEQLLLREWDEEEGV
ncbi:hypothetical protein N0V88_005744 [Collariella sp. IMI 366227]|nr:hypothetical protein N0V88_005744 [Collariella sp. IMI 366227]